MKRGSLDRLWVLLLFGVLAAVTAGAAINQARQENEAPLLSTSSSPQGARALRLWLQSLGYRTDETGRDDFHIPPKTKLFVLLEPSFEVTATEWQEIDDWVQRGGILWMASQGRSAVSLLDHFEFTPGFIGNPRSARLQNPLLHSPVLPAEIPVQARIILQTQRQDFVTHLAVDGEPVLVSLRVGSGQVFVSSATYPFSNAGLKEAGNAELVFNLLAGVEAPAEVLFDEWHHGQRNSQDLGGGPQAWLMRTPSGQAVLFSAGVLFLALLLNGRHFGRPLPSLDHTTRRAPLEYITGLANLSRRSARSMPAHRLAVLADLRMRLKRELGRRYRLDPSLPDAHWIAELARLRPEMDLQALRTLLERLAQPHHTERQLLDLARQVHHWLHPEL